MTVELTSAAEQAVLERVRLVLRRSPETPLVVAVRSAARPTWSGPAQHNLDGHAVTVAPCSSILAVLDALADQDPSPRAVLVIYTQLADTDLGDAILARLHQGQVLQADRHTLLDGLLRTQAQDPRVRREPWLVDALIELARRDALPSTAGVALTRAHALAAVTTARLGLDPHACDLPDLVLAFDDADIRRRWRDLEDTEREGLTSYLEAVHGREAGVLARLAAGRDDVLADLLAGHAIARSMQRQSAGIAFGRWAEPRLPRGHQRPDDVARLGEAAAAAARRTDTIRVRQQVARGDTILDELDAADLVGASDVLHRGFDERLAAAAVALSEDAIAYAEAHQQARSEPERVDRLRAAMRLRRWIGEEPSTDVADVGVGLHRHATDLAWVDRALAAVRVGDSDPRVQPVLYQVSMSAGALRARVDRAFAARVAAATDTPSTTLAVETFLRLVVEPLSRSHRVLLVVVDGMSGAVAGDLADDLTGPREGWTEVTRSVAGEREAVLAALPSETTYSRTSLLTAELRAGTQTTEKAVFPTLACWGKRRAVLVHKAGLSGTEGRDLGEELDHALDAEHGADVVGVVLNAVDDSLTQGRQSTDPRWRPRDVTGLPALLGRAAESGRTVVLVSDHGHVLEHGAELRSATSGGARWRAPDGPVHDDEVRVTGLRVLAPNHDAVFAATEEVRYGKRNHGYHGGVTLAEMAIPLLVLVPPGADVPDGWAIRSDPPPAWWSGASSVPSTDTPSPAPIAPPQRRRRRAPEQSEVPTLFDTGPTPAPAESARTRGRRLVASAAFEAEHEQVPKGRRPSADAIADVVDALLDAGGRLPLATVAARAGGAGRNPRGVVESLRRVLNRESYAVLSFVDGGQAVALDRELLNEQFPEEPR